MSHAVSGRIVRSTGILAGAIGISRVLGFIRDILLAGLFGTTLQAQAFVVAFRLPNLLRDLVAEGAVTSAFVPVLSWYRAKRDPEEFWHLAQALWSRVVVLVCVLGLLGSWGAPWIVRVVAPGFLADPEKFALTVRLTRILFPFVTLVGLWAYFMGLLNTLGHFAAPGLGPAILNLSMIAGCLWLVPRMSHGAVAVAISVLVGGVIQLAVQVPVAVRMGFRWRWRWRHPGSREILHLLGPRMVGSAVYETSVIVDTALASLGAIVGEGAVAALYFANRLLQLPLALFGTAAAQASLPTLSSLAAHEDYEGFRRTVLSVIRMIGFVTIPASIGLIVLAFPIVGGLFQRGAFDHRATVMTSQALICYATGLFAFAADNVVIGAFYALKDTRTPVRLAMQTLLANVLLSVALMWPLKVAGLALAAAMTNSLNAYRLTRRLEQRLGGSLLASIAGPLLRMTAASLVMGAGCFVLWRFGLAHAKAWVSLPILIGSGVVLYGVACRLLRVQELSTAVRWLSRLPSVSD